MGNDEVGQAMFDRQYSRGDPKGTTIDGPEITRRNKFCIWQTSSGNYHKQKYLNAAIGILHVEMTVGIYIYRYI